MEINIPDLYDFVANLKIDHIASMNGTKMIDQLKVITQDKVHYSEKEILKLYVD